MFKHRIKMALRESWARLVFHTGLHALIDRVMPARFTILAGHCVETSGGRSAGDSGAHLPPDMKISTEKLGRILGWFAPRYQMCTIGDGVQALAGGKLERSRLAVSMDDGYRDNAHVLLPLLQSHNAPATIFLESRPLDERRVNWSHKYFWILKHLDAGQFLERYAALTSEAEVAAKARAQVAGDPERASYQFKRALKYEADPAERDRVIDALFAELGGDEGQLCDELYMSWDDARRLRDAGIELGGHTVNHVILSRCEPAEARREIEDGAASMERELGAPAQTFAYPWGRRWDFNDATREAVRGAGFASAVTMHAGTNHPGDEPTTLKRLAIAEDAQLHLLATEACGGFDLLRRVGLDLSE